MSSPAPSRYCATAHAAAVTTALLALLPIALGAQTTTKDAGMAFPDWPTSDGQGMLTYPWLSATGAKFLEHGHRLAGVLIGISSLVLLGSLLWKERRVWVKWMGAGVVAAVIGQGVLGGIRVLYNSKELALVHGSTAPLVFGFMACVALVTSRAWIDPPTMGAARIPSNVLGWMSIATLAGVYLQYVLGGLVRHRGEALLEHLVFAFVVALAIVVVSILASLTEHPWLQIPSMAAGLFLLVQLGLGAGTWATKYGIGEAGNPVYGSTEQITFRTLHVMNGMLLFASVLLLTGRIQRLRWLLSQFSRGMLDSADAARWGLPGGMTPAGIPMTGGAR